MIYAQLRIPFSKIIRLQEDHQSSCPAAIGFERYWNKNQPERFLTNWSIIILRNGFYR